MLLVVISLTNISSSYLELNCVIFEAGENLIKSIMTFDFTSPEADGVPDLGSDEELPSTGGDHKGTAVNVITPAVGLVVRFSYPHTVEV